MVIKEEAIFELDKLIGNDISKIGFERELDDTNLFADIEQWNITQNIQLNLNDNDDDIKLNFEQFMKPLIEMEKKKVKQMTNLNDQQLADAELYAGVTFNRKTIDSMKLTLYNLRDCLQ